MTNEQAKNIIESCDGIMWNQLTDTENEALSMAIEALSAQPEQGCDECIFKPFKQFQPERKGNWSIKNGELTIWDVCSECGRMVIHRAPFYNFCPNCGADMRGDL